MMLYCTSRYRLFQVKDKAINIMETAHSLAMIDVTASLAELAAESVSIIIIIIIMCQSIPHSGMVQAKCCQ